jgi:hypothetical protein
MLRMVTRFLEALAVLSLAFIWGFSTYLENNRPAHPIGNFTVEIVNHGSSYFVSHQEHVVSVLAWPLFFVLTVLAGGLEAALRNKP